MSNNTNTRNDIENNNHRNGGGLPKWSLSLLTILIALGLLYFLMKKCDDKATLVEDTSEIVVEKSNLEPGILDNTIKGRYDSINNQYIYNTGAERTITLPNGTTITVGEASTEAQLYDFLNDENKLVSDNNDEGWITMDRIYFESNVDHLIPDSKIQLDNVVKILKNYPNTTVRFGGFTDSQAGQKINMPLSQDRAEEALNYIANKGIDRSRLEAKGYGQSKFLCPENDTPECRAKNRRVDIKVLKK